MQGRRPCPRSAERGILLMLYKDQEGGLRGKPYQGVSPFSFGLYVCADTLGGGRYPVLRFDPISLVLAQRNGVEPPKKSAFLAWRLHHPRERCQSVDGTFLARLGAWLGAGRGNGAHVEGTKKDPRLFGRGSVYLALALMASMSRGPAVSITRRRRVSGVSPSSTSTGAWSNISPTSPLSSGA